MSKKTRKKSSKSPIKASARVKPRKSSTTKSAAKKGAATKKKVAPKAAKVKASKARSTKVKSPKAGAPKTEVRAKSGAASKVKSAATPKAKPTAIKSSTKPGTKTKAAPVASRPAAVVPVSAEIATETIRHSGPLTEGATVPAFKLPRDGGEVISLAPKAGRKLVIFFYPRADTPGCTKEAMDFSRLSVDFDAARTDVVGVSADPLKAQEAFRNKHDLKVPLLSDETHEILESFGVWGDKSMYGRVFQGVLRTTVVVGSDRKILKIWHSVKVDGHADEVLEYVKSR